MAMFGFLVLLIVTWGTIVFLLGIGALFSYFRNRKAQAVLHGSGLRVDERQFPEVYRSVCSQAKRLGMKEIPDVYIIENSTQNAFAMKHGKKHSLALVDDLIYGALLTKKPEVLDFIIGHELAHHALGHTKLIRSTLRVAHSRLSRLDEFSCDSVANALVGNPRAALDAIAIMLVGPQLFVKVNRDALDTQVQEVAKDRYSRKSEAGLTHPLLLRRYARILNPSLK